MPLLEFGREREEIDLSKVMLTHHNTEAARASARCRLAKARSPSCRRSTRRAPARCSEKEKALLAEIIAKVNDLFEGDLTDDDRLVYVNNVLKGKLLESETLVAAGSQQHQGAVRQLARPVKPSSCTPSWMRLRRTSTMSTQALNSERVREGLKDVLLGPAQLYEALRERSNRPLSGRDD